MNETQQRDRQLADILQDVTEGPVEERPSLEELQQRHPHLADELQELWGAVMVVDAVAVGSPPKNSSRATPTPSPRDAPPPNELGDFHLSEEIGRGGMGIVYRAEQQSLGRPVALKILLRGADASPDDQARFQAEAEAAAQLAHPSIVPIYEAGEVDGWRYIGMKLIEGETLAQRLADGPLDEADAARLVLKIAQGIQYAHDQGVIHRDLKPSNILLDARQEPHVSDFGLAKRVADNNAITATGAILGTPSYMAPEQASGGRGEVGPLCDVFSLGAILYALVTGRPPHQGATPVDTVLSVLEQDPLPPRLLNRRVSRDLEMIVLRCLQKPSELRYQSAGALANDLEAFLSGDPIMARSGQFSHVVARVFGETHHATVLENWGLLWMWHAAVLLVLCSVTNLFSMNMSDWPIMQQHWPYVALWGGGVAMWAPIFWALRSRKGPVTAVERQIAHAWGGSMVAVILLFAVESLLGLQVLTLSPVLGLIAGMVFVVKAGVLSGAFYLHATALFTCGVIMAYMHRADSPYDITLFGLVCAAVFFLPGWKYYRQNERRNAARS